MGVISPIYYPADKLSRLVQDGVVLPPSLDWPFVRKGNLSMRGRSTLMLTEGAPDTYFNDTDVSSLLGSANALLVEARTGNGAGVLCQIDDGTELERYRIERNVGNEIRVIITDGGVEQANLNMGAVANLTNFKIATRLGANDFAASLDGGAVIADAAGTLPTVDTVRFGMDTSGNPWNSTIARVALWNVGRTNGLLQSVTA